MASLTQPGYDVLLGNPEKEVIIRCIRMRDTSGTTLWSLSFSQTVDYLEVAGPMYGKVPKALSSDTVLLST